MKLAVKVLADGKLEAANDNTRDALEAMKPGLRLFLETTRLRSSKQNRTFFACIEYAWSNQRREAWDTPEQLRAAAFVEVGFKDTVIFPLKNPTQAEINAIEGPLSVIASWWREKDRHVFARVVPDGLAIDIPKSWQFKKADHYEATRVMQAVLEWLCLEVVPGMTAEQLVQAAQDAVKHQHR